MQNLRSLALHIPFFQYRYQHLRSYTQGGVRWWVSTERQRMLGAPVSKIAFLLTAIKAQSTLSFLEPFRRGALGIPFLYQRISSTSPITALISTKSPITSLSVLHLNGTVDWMVTQRKGLLAWTGHTLSVSPRINRGMSIAHWGNTQVTGRGLVAVAGSGQIYQVTLKPGEEYIAYPGNVMAYTITQNPPLPYRFKSSNLRFQIPNLGLGYLVPDTKFFRVMKQSSTWQGLTRLLFNLRTLLRRTIWSDRLFLQFRGPTTLLLSSRASRISDVLTTRDLDEIADSPAGVAHSAVTLAASPKEEAQTKKLTSDVPTRFQVASVGADGKVKFGEAESPKVFAR